MPIYRSFQLPRTHCWKCVFHLLGKASFVRQFIKYKVCCARSAPASSILSGMIYHPRFSETKNSIGKWEKDGNVNVRDLYGQILCSPNSIFALRLFFSCCCCLQQSKQRPDQPTTLCRSNLLLLRTQCLAFLIDRKLNKVLNY